MFHKHMLLSGIRIKQARGHILMQALAGNYALLKSCDVILGGDFLEKIGLNLKYDTLEMEWLGNVVPMEMLNTPEAVGAHGVLIVSDGDGGLGC